MTVGTIRAAVLARVVRKLDARSGRTDLILHEAGLSRTLLRDEYALVSLKSYAHFFELAAAEAGDRWFGLRLGAEVKPLDVGPIGALMSNARTLAQSLDDLCRNIRALQSATELRVLRRGADTHVIYKVTDPTVGPAVQDAEFTLSATCHFIRCLFGQRWSPIEVHFHHPTHHANDLAREILGAPVAFRCPANRIVMRSADLALEQPLLQPDLRDLLARHVADLIQDDRPRGSVSERVDAVIALLLPHGVPTLARVAAEFGWSPRSLQRGLTEEGTSLRLLVQHHRCRVAQAMLDERSHSNTDIAHALGYADATVFWRAFKQWTGKSPSKAKSPSKSKGDG